MRRWDGVREGGRPGQRGRKGRGSSLHGGCAGCMQPGEDSLLVRFRRVRLNTGPAVRIRNGLRACRRNCLV